jgi:hypothetical protein
MHEGAGTPTHLELVYLVHGQLGDALTLVGVGSPPSAALAQHLVSVAQSRL